MMKTGWIMAAAAALALSAMPVDLAAQGNAAAARERQQQARGQADRAQRERAAEVERQRQRELEWERQARDRERQVRDRDREREQERQREWERQREREWERERQRDRGRQGRDVNSRQQRGGSPSFCRSGEGHPVFGRQWCREKGFGLGSERWDSRRMGDVILRQPRSGRYDQRLDRRGLVDVLGDVVFSRFDTLGRQHGSGPVYGTWLDNGYGYGSSLQLWVGSVPFAELVDTNRDGRVDRVLVRR
jgi:hypothetical protein